MTCQEIWALYIFVVHIHYLAVFHTISSERNAMDWKSAALGAFLLKCQFTPFSFRHEKIFIIFCATDDNEFMWEKVHKYSVLLLHLLIATLCVIRISSESAFDIQMIIFKKNGMKCVQICKWSNDNKWTTITADGVGQLALTFSKSHLLSP